MKNDQPFSKGALIIYQRYLQKKRDNGKIKLGRFISYSLPEDSVESEKLQILMNLRPNFLKKLDLSGLDLSGTNLQMVYLPRGDLQGANLSGGDLRWTRLSGANLTETNFSGARFGFTSITDSLD